MKTNNETERTVKNDPVRGRLREVSPYSCGDILQRITDAFVVNGGFDTGWRGKIKNLRLTETDSGDRSNMWHHSLDGAVGPEEQVYLIFEDANVNGAKYRIYEIYPSELSDLLDETDGLGEFYIVSREFRWLIFVTNDKKVFCSGEIHIK